MLVLENENVNNISDKYLYIKKLVFYIVHLCKEKSLKEEKKSVYYHILQTRCLTS